MPLGAILALISSARLEQYKSHSVISEQSIQCTLSFFGIFSSQYTCEKTKIR